MIGKPRRAAAGNVEKRDFGRAAADVEEHDAIRVALDQRAAAGNGKPRLGAAVDDLQLDAGLGLHAVEKLGAVLGSAAGLGRHQPCAAHLAAAQLVGADLQRLDGAVHGRVAQPAARRQPLAEAHDARIGVDDAELPGPAGRRDEQPAIVGAEIERGKERRQHRGNDGRCLKGPFDHDDGDGWSLSSDGHALRLARAGLGRKHFPATLALAPLLARLGARRSICGRGSGEIRRKPLGIERPGSRRRRLPA